jgi:hypothetical protein
MVRVVLLVSLLLLAASSNAHIAGATYTSMWVAQDGVLLEYTVPADSLMELNALPGEPARLGPTRYYAHNIVDGFALTNNGTPCTAILVAQRTLNEIGSYQYTLRYSCETAPQALVIEYHVFSRAPDSHENFVDIHIGELKLDRVLSARQSRLEIGPDALGMRDRSSIPTNLPESASVTPGLLHFLKFGFEHILAGPDHIVFLLTLLLIAMARSELLLLVTIFTLAHSVTLALSGLNIVSVDVRVAEMLIALSIAYVAIENVVHLYTSERAAPSRAAAIRRRITVFVFGLVHGFGFSFVLKEIGLPRGALPQSLLAFNIGIEGGQLLVIALALPLVMLAWKALSYRRASVIASAITGLIGTYWFLGRI